MSDNNTTALAKRENGNAAGFADKITLQETVDLIRQIVPGADKAPDKAVFMLAQKAIAHDLDLFDDNLYLADFGGRWTAHVGIKGQRRNAEGEYYFRDDDKYPRRLEEDEMKKDFGGTFKPGTIGIEVCLYNLTKARQVQALGIPYSPRRERGYWLPNGNVPVGRHPAWVAQKHAEMQALTAEFPLKSRSASRQDAEEYLEFKGRQLNREMAIPANRPRLTEAEMDGEIPEAQYRQAAADGEYIELGSPSAGSGQAVDEADVDFGMGGGDEPPPADTVDVPPELMGWLEYLHNLHVGSPGPAKPEMHNFLVGVIDKICGQDAHRDVLGVIVGRDVTSANPEGYDLCKDLLNGLVVERTDKETGAKVPNVKHNPQYVADIKTIWNSIMESKGQMTMPLEAEAVPY